MLFFFQTKNSTIVYDKCLSCVTTKNSKFFCFFQLEANLFELQQLPLTTSRLKRPSKGKQGVGKDLFFVPSGKIPLLCKWGMWEHVISEDTSNENDV
jgi:hypothetical protein